MSEDQCFDAVESLRAKTPPLVIRVDTPGSRVHKYRHNAGDVLHARGGELAILTELLLRGPQTVGELRGRASRMSPMESIEITQGLLTAMMTREEPLVRELPPAPGSRANRFVQLLCPELHPIDATASAAPSAESSPTAASADPSLHDRVAKLEAEVAELKQLVRGLATPPPS
jgi:uncharacterized protein YceH (UPF0502 family)